uniref:Uncharacterized protein n=1 Tax=viral metagenome TaxID=1070528 RepID=A0A6C0H8G7_9ZZZZ
MQFIFFENKIIDYNYDKFDNYLNKKFINKIIIIN